MTAPDSELLFPDEPVERLALRVEAHNVQRVKRVERPAVFQVHDPAVPEIPLVVPCLDHASPQPHWLSLAVRAHKCNTPKDLEGSVPNFANRQHVARAALAKGDE